MRITVIPWEYNYDYTPTELRHAGIPGMKWGYNKGKRNGNRIAELLDNFAENRKAGLKQLGIGAEPRATTTIIRRNGVDTEAGTKMRAEERRNMSEADRKQAEAEDRLFDAQVRQKEQIYKNNMKDADPDALADLRSQIRKDNIERANRNRMQDEINRMDAADAERQQASQYAKQQKADEIKSKINTAAEKASELKDTAKEKTSGAINSIMDKITGKSQRDAVAESNQRLADARLNEAQEPERRAKKDEESLKTLKEEETKCRVTLKKIDTNIGKLAKWTQEVGPNHPEYGKVMTNLQKLYNDRDTWVKHQQKVESTKNIIDNRIKRRKNPGSSEYPVRT